MMSVVYRTAATMQKIFVCLVFLLASNVAVAQGNSVRPGINDSFRDPAPKAFTERFEIESREVFSKNYMVVFESDDQKPAAKPELQFPIIEGFGGVVAVSDAVDAPRAGMKVVLDVTAEAKKPEDVNKGLERAARLLNLYGVSGLKASDLKISVVLHGEATRSVISDAAWESRFQMKDNPNLPLIRLLQKAGVEVLVCGQALSYKQIDRGEVAAEVPVAAAALTVLLNRQADGFSYVPVP